MLYSYLPFQSNEQNDITLEYKIRYLDWNKYLITNYKI